MNVLQVEVVNSSEDNKITEVCVEAAIEVSVGQVVRIHPSEAYQGIDSGLITVQQIATVEGLTGEARKSAEIFIESSTDLATSDTERSELSAELFNCTWVAYTYNKDGDTVSLPLYEFVSHTTSY